VKYLVFCPCGHSLERHGYEGCDGDGDRTCSCAHDSLAALDAAIERARADAYTVWKKPEAGGDAEAV